MRHGETVWNADGRVSGWTDVPLTPRGEHQARGLRTFLEQHRFDSVWSSDLSRARTTARLAWGEPRVDERLREFDFGAIEGLPWETLDPLHKNALLDFEGFCAPSGETVERFRSRVLALVEELEPGRHLLFVHALLVRLILREVGDDKFLPPSSLVAVDWSSRRLLFVRAATQMPL